VKLFRVFSLLILLLGGCSQVEQQPNSKEKEEVVLRAYVDKAQVKLSEVFEYRISLDYKAGLGEVEIPEVGSMIKGLRILEPVIKDPVLLDGRVIKEKIYRLMPDFTGSFRLPPVKLKFLDKEYSTPSVFVEVLSEEQSLEGMEDILDIEDLKREKYQRDYSGWYVLAGALILLLLGWFLYKKGLFEEEVEIPLTTYEWFDKYGQDIQQQELLQKGKRKEYCFALSFLSRGYLSRRFEISAEESTLEELLILLQGVECEEKIKQTLVNVFKELEMGKFAEIFKSDERLKSYFSMLQEFVVQTTEEVAQDEEYVEVEGEE
jgi:hypothetical protein